MLSVMQQGQSPHAGPSSLPGYPALRTTTGVYPYPYPASTTLVPAPPMRIKTEQPDMASFSCYAG